MFGSHKGENVMDSTIEHHVLEISKQTEEIIKQMKRQADAQEKFYDLILDYLKFRNVGFRNRYNWNKKFWIKEWNGRRKMKCIYKLRLYGAFENNTHYMFWNHNKRFWKAVKEIKQAVRLREKQFNMKFIVTHLSCGLSEK